jgi:hypothetical protein
MSTRSQTRQPQPEPGRREWLTRLLAAGDGADSRYLVFLIVIAPRLQQRHLVRRGLCVLGREFIVGAGFAALQAAGSLLLPHIKPGQELEDITT